jgi:hypothetical protein
VIHPTDVVEKRVRKTSFAAAKKLKRTQSIVVDDGGINNFSQYVVANISPYQTNAKVMRERIREANSQVSLFNSLNISKVHGCF